MAGIVRVFLIAWVLSGLSACVTEQTVARSPAQDPAGGSAEARNVLQVPDLSLPAGARLDADRSLIVGAGDRWLGRLVVRSDFSPVQAFNHFHNGMPPLGWSLVAAIQSKVSHLTYLRGERVATIQVEPSTLSGVTISITVSPRPAAAAEPQRAPR